MMAKDNLILDKFKPEMFRDWISGEKYKIVTDRPFKGLGVCSTQVKVDIYNTLKNI